MKYYIVLFSFFSVVLFSQKINTKKAPQKSTLTQTGVAEKSIQTEAHEEGKINWITIEEAEKLVKIKPKKIFIDFNTTWCGPCKMLDKNTFQNPDVVKYVNENYYAVNFNAERKEPATFKDKTYKNPNYVQGQLRNYPHELAQAMGVKAYPTIVFLNENLDIITPIMGYYNVKQFELYLKLFHQNDHLNISTKEQWETYQKNFKFEFKFSE